MTRRHIAPILTTGIIALCGFASAAPPTADQLVGMAISASETESTLAEHNMIQASIHQEETTTEGKSETQDFTAVFHGGGLENVRLELGPGISLVLNGSKGWGMIQGQLDTREQAPRMAPGTIRQIVFPLLLPYSLKLEGVRLGSVTEGHFDSTPVWVVDVRVDPSFFAAPSMAGTWKVFFGREDHFLLGAEIFPPETFRQVRGEGIRYRVLKRDNVDGISLPSQLLLEGVDENGAENGHVRVTKIAYKTVGPYDPSIFLHPDKLKKIEEGDIE